MTGDCWTVPLSIRTYRMRVESIPDDYTFEQDVFEALIGRSALQERWAELTGEQCEEVRRIDDVLVGLHARVAELLPAGGFHPLREWWWHLDQGPKVREETERATT